MGAPKRADWREERRKRAWALKQAGWPQKDIAQALGVSEGAVSQWLRVEQRAQLPALVARGAEVYGFRGDVWTARRVAQLIADTFGVRYHRDHVSRLLRQLGWSRQRPIERAPGTPPPPWCSMAPRPLPGRHSVAWPRASRARLPTCAPRW